MSKTVFKDTPSLEVRELEMTKELEIKKGYSDYEVAARIIEMSQKVFAPIYYSIRKTAKNMVPKCEIEGSYKEDITRIVMKLKEYRKKDEENKVKEPKPWMKINDGVRMAITVTDPKDAYDLTKKIIEAHLGRRRVLKLESKLT